MNYKQKLGYTSSGAQDAMDFGHGLAMALVTA